MREELAVTVAQVRNALVGAGHEPVCYGETMLVSGPGFLVEATHSPLTVLVSHWLPFLLAGENLDQAAREEAAMDAISAYAETVMGMNLFTVRLTRARSGYPYLYVQRVGYGTLG